MPRGGVRPNAGRKPGSANTATKERMEIAKRAAESGITPLEVMLNIMRTAYDDGDMETAHSAAKDAAPYIHSKMASMELKAELTTPKAITFRVVGNE